MLTHFCSHWPLSSSHSSTSVNTKFDIELIFKKSFLVFTEAVRFDAGLLVISTELVTGETGADDATEENGTFLLAQVDQGARIFVSGHAPS